jgi:hypothetical protein
MSSAMTRTRHAVAVILGLVLCPSPTFITVAATSLDVMSGQSSATTDASGNYDIPLPSQTDHSLVALENLPSGHTVVLPAGGS